MTKWAITITADDEKDEIMDMLSFDLEKLGVKLECVKDASEDEGYMSYELSKLKLCEESYREGYKDAVRNYAIHKDGEQLVGCMATPLKVVLNEVDNAPVPIRY